MLDIFSDPYFITICFKVKDLPSLCGRPFPIALAVVWHNFAKLVLNGNICQVALLLACLGENKF